MEQYSVIRQKVTIWQILFYFSMFILTLWLILKIIGVIQTPFWLEYGIPGFGLIIGVFSLYHNLIENIKQLGIGFATLSVRLGNLETEVHSIKQDVLVIKKKIKM